jgi:hypothetical protein
VAIGIAAYAVDTHLVAWIGGLLAGGGSALLVSFRETPPRYVETYREGAEGERRAEKALRPLERDGWRVFHDVQTGYGNYDHVAVGPTGVYLIESKNLQGVVRVKAGVPRLTRRHDPRQVIPFRRIKPTALDDAGRIGEEIRRRTGRRPWVQAVVVFWSEFPEGFVQDGRCVFIEGSKLRPWLEERPAHLSDAEVQAIAAGVEGIADERAEPGVGRRPARLNPA